MKGRRGARLARAAERATGKASICDRQEIAHEGVIEVPRDSLHRGAALGANKTHRSVDRLVA